MRVRPSLSAIAVLAVATAAQAQSPLDRLVPPVTTQPSTPTPAQPIVRPGLPSRPAPTLQVRAASDPFSGVGDTGHTVRIDQRQIHPNGVVMTLDSVTYRSASIVVAASILNTTDRVARLNPGGGLQLVDDRGQSYPFVPPPNNPEVQIAPRSRVGATFVFVGPVVSGARVLQLSTNARTGSRNDRLTAAPAFTFSLPVRRAG